MRSNRWWALPQAVLCRSRQHGRWSSSATEGDLIVVVCHPRGRLFGRLTQVLYILIGCQREDPALLSLPHASAVCLVDDDTISDACREEGGTVGEGRPSRGRVEGDVRQAVAECRQQQRDVAGEPGKLQCLRKSSKALA